MRCPGRAALLVGLRVVRQESPISFASGAASGAALAGLDVHPGQPVSYAAFLASSPAGYRYQVTSVSLIPLPGFRTPRLLGAMFLLIKGPPVAARGYPPRQPNGTRYPAHP